LGPVVISLGGRCDPDVEVPAFAFAFEFAGLRLPERETLDCVVSTALLLLGGLLVMVLALLLFGFAAVAGSA
jgi:hypothetical protein